jgi:hypothetical protein
MVWTGRIGQHGDATALGRDFLEELQPLAGELRAQGAQARDVAPWVRQAGDEPLPNRITGARHHNRDRARGVLGRPDRVAAPRHDDVHLEPNQLGRQVGEPLVPPLRIPVLNDEVLALDVVELAQTLPEGF